METKAGCVFFALAVCHLVNALRFPESGFKKVHLKRQDSNQNFHKLFENLSVPSQVHSHALNGNSVVSKEQSNVLLEVPRLRKVSSVHSLTRKSHVRSDSLPEKPHTRIVRADPLPDGLEVVVGLLSEKLTALETDNLALRTQIGLLQEREDGLENQLADIHASSSTQGACAADCQASLHNMAAHVQTLQAKNTALESRMVALETENQRLQQNVTGLQAPTGTLGVVEQKSKILEISMQKLEETSHDVNNNVKSLEALTQILTTQLGHLEENVAKNATSLQIIQSVITTLLSDNAHIKNQLQNSSSRSIGGTVAFFAHAGTAEVVVGVSGLHTLVLPVALTNQGGSYNSQTGVMTAPVGGLYLFAATVGFTVGEASDTDISVFIAVDDVHISGGTYPLSHFSTEVITLHALVKLTPGQRVRLTSHSSNQHHQKAVASVMPGPTTGFSGILVGA